MVALYLDNKREWYAAWRAALRDVVASDRDEEWLDIRAGQAIRDYVTDLLDLEYQTSLSRMRSLSMIARDIGSLWRVSWTDLGREYLRLLSEE